MRLLDFFRSSPPSAPAAKERLQILLAHDRAGRTGPDFLPRLQKDLLRVVAKYIDIDHDKVMVRVEQSSGRSILELNVEIPFSDDAIRRQRARA